MQAREEALQRYFATRSCTSSHYQQRPETVLVLVRRARAWMVMVTCGHCHHRGLFVVSFPARAAKKATAPAPTTILAPIGYRDVHEMQSFLDSFNGDFLALFGPGPQGHLATE